jgi:hypothetical protein
MAFSDQRQFLVTIEGLDGTFWAQTSGGALNLPTSLAWDGGNPTPQIVTGNPTVDALVCTRNYDPVTVGAISAQMKASINSGQPFATTITQTPSDPAYSPLSGGELDTWTGILTKVQTPVTDASKSGANVATLALTFTCTKLT